MWSKHKFTTIEHLQICHAHYLFFSWCRMESPHCMSLPKGETQTWWSSCWIVEGRSMPKPGWVLLFPEYDVIPSWEWIAIFFFYLFGFFVCFFLSQRLGTSRFIARHSASVIALYVLSLHWDIKCTCYKWLKENPTKHQKIFSWTEFQKHWILLLQKYTVLKLELNLYGDSKNNLKRNIFVSFFCIQNLPLVFRLFILYTLFSAVSD